LELLQQEKVSVAAALRRPGRDGLTPLGVAVSEYRGPSEADELKDVHVFQALLAHGADYRLNDHCNRRVFYLACASGKTEIVKRLVEHHIATSSNPESKGNRSRSPRKHIHKAEGDSLEVFLNEAAFTHWKALKKSKLNPNTYKTPVFAAAVNMQLGVLKALVDISMRHGVFLDVNGAETRIRRTPLMDACFSLGRPELAACLLAHPECDPNLAEDDGGTALSDACFAGNVECVALLIQHNVDAHIVDKGGLAALHFACGRGQVKVAKLMLAYHARTNDVWCKKTFSTLHILEEVAAKVARADSLHSDAFAEYKLAFPTAQPPPKHAKTVSNPKLKPVLKALCVDQVTRGLGPEQYLVNLAEIHTACRALECMVESRRLSCAAAAVGGPPVMDRQLLGHSGMRAPPPRHLPQWLVRQQRQRQSKDAKKEP
jgi:ankyrin repeat protein